MRKALIPAFLLVVTAIVLGSTVFREQVVSAATTPFQNVVVTNTSTNPIPVTQVGTSTTSVSGTVGIDPSKNTVKLDSGGNTVKLDSNGNTVNLDSTDAANLANVESKLANLNFDSGGNLETAAQTASPGAVTEQCLDSGGSGWSVNNDDVLQTLCTDDVYATDLTATRMDDSLAGLLPQRQRRPRPRGVGLRRGGLVPVRSHPSPPLRQDHRPVRQRQHVLRLQPRRARQLDRQLTT